MQPSGSAPATRGNAQNAQIITTSQTSILRSPPVTIVAGARNEMQELTLHRDLLCQYCSYFAGAYRTTLKETQTTRFEFNDVPRLSAEALGSWLYFGRLYNPKDSSEVNSSGKDAGKRTAITLTAFELVGIWTFGDRVHCPNIQNEVINVLHKRGHENRSVCPMSIARTYRTTVPRSMLRKFFAEMVARSVTPQGMKRIMRVPDFLSDLCIRLGQLREEPELA